VTSILTPLPRFTLTFSATDRLYNNAKIGTNIVVESQLSRIFVSEGHLIDSGMLASILNGIIDEKADYEILDFDIGKTNLETSRIELDVRCDSAEQLVTVTERLVEHGCHEKRVSEAATQPAEAGGCVPEDFYSTTNHRTEVFSGGEWRVVGSQRMDGVIVIENGQPVCRKLRDVRAGDEVVCSTESIRLFPPERERLSDSFGFMGGDVSSERSIDVAVNQLADALIDSRTHGRKIVMVAGPVLVHAGGSDAFQYLIREGFLGALLSGNALAVHDIEHALFGTSLGLDLKTGRPAPGGHRNHMRGINVIRRHGSIQNAIDSGALKAGIMYELIQNSIPYCLAASIRDDGPLPETLVNIIEAQERYAELVEGASLVLMLSTMLHSIGVGNMLPSGVTTVCIDINPAVVTKLSDRGSSQAIGIVSDVGFFVRALADRIRSIDNRVE